MIYTHISNEGYYVALSQKEAEIAVKRLHGILHECISFSDCLELIQREAKERHAHPPTKVIMGKLADWEYITSFIWIESQASAKFVFTMDTGEVQVWFDERLVGSYKNSYSINRKSSLITAIWQRVGYIPLYSFAEKKTLYVNLSGEVCELVQQLLPLEDQSSRPKLSKS